MIFSLRAGTGGEFVLSTRAILVLLSSGLAPGSHFVFCFSFFLAISASNSLLIFSCCSWNLFSNFNSSSSSFNFLSSFIRLLNSNCSFKSSSYFFLFSHGSLFAVGDSRMIWWEMVSYLVKNSPMRGRGVLQVHYFYGGTNILLGSGCSVSLIGSNGPLKVASQLYTGHTLELDVGASLFSHQSICLSFSFSFLLFWSAICNSRGGMWLRR